MMASTGDDNVKWGGWFKDCAIVAAVFVALLALVGCLMSRPVTRT
jgi:hypothetical protein